MRYPCYACDGRGCESCDGSGVVEGSRIEAWCRRRRYFGLHHPRADRNGNEKWVRFSVEVPPEFVPLLEQAQRASMGVNYRPSRASVVRAALYRYLEEYLPPEAEPAIDGEWTELLTRAAIGSGED